LKEFAARVTKWMKDADRRPIGIANRNLILDSRQYKVEFPDGTTEAYCANTITKNLYSQIDSEGHQFMILKEITNHRSDATAIIKEDGDLMTRSGNKKPKRTTKGWKLCVECNDGTRNWILLKDLKESNPIDVAEYAKANKIDDEPPFKWWVPFVLKKKDRIISKVKSKYWRTTHKFGIELPPVEEAHAIDAKNGTLY